MHEAADSRNAEIHRKIAAALADLVPSDPAIPPHPYLRRHLAEHAAEGHVLDDDHVPPALLAWETSSGVRQLLAAHEEGLERREWLQAWAGLEPFAQQAGPLSRLSSMRLAQYSTSLLPSQSGPTPSSAASQTLQASPVTPLWSDCVAPVPAWTTTGKDVTAMATVVNAGGQTAAVAVGDGGGSLRILRRDGSLAHAPITVHTGAVSHLLAAGGDLVVTAGMDGCVAVVDALHGRLVQKVVTCRPQTWVSSLTSYRPPGHLPLVLAAFSDGHIAAFDIGRLQIHPVPLPELQDSSAIICGITRADKHPCLLFTGRDTVHCFDGHNQFVHSRHPARIRALLALPQPGQYAVADEDGNVSVHDLTDTTGSAAPLAVAAHAAPVTALLVTFLDRQPALASAAGDGTVRLWRLPGLEPVDGELPAHAAPVTAMTRLTGDTEDRLLTGGADRLVRRWTVARPTFGRPPQARNHVTASALSPSPPHLLAVARAARVVVWNLTSNTQRTLLEGQKVTALAWPRVQGRLLLAAALSDNKIVCVDPDTGKQAGPDMTGHLLPARALVALSTKQGELLVSGSGDGQVRIWKPQTGQLLRKFGDHQFSVRCLATHRNLAQTLVASGGGDGNVRVWDADRLEQHGQTIKCDQDVINDLAFVKESDRLLVASAGQDGTLKLWDVSTAEKAHELTLEDGELSAVTALPLPQERTAVAAAGTTGIHVWDVTTGRRLLSIVTGSPIRSLKTVQDPDRDASSILLASGEAGTMAFHLDREQLW
ncbi:WD40 repeat domain-containing protein [Streptomyces sp. Tu 3180]|uniref:WD40 repeat domain-containing protein n=1 Tax=Streptomyces sp. Tu 3180 TaxID=2682611 RepID=UPI00135A8CEF|nr:WD40 repeat domain-containing protein [Streptomyces sp. Tu 3180]KAF3470035.1 WD40 repeat domain-containing protein [Streptomyces sp. Tu 3180]